MEKRQKKRASPVDKAWNRRTNHETRLKDLFPPTLNFIVL